MRDYKGMKRQRGRNRNVGGGGGGQQGGGKPGQNANRAFDSNGPDNIKVRGHAQHVYEKYNQLARDATSAGDRVLAENHLQHAEHYFRTLRVLQPNRPVTEIVGRDTFVGGFDLDFEDEALESAMAEADAAAAAAPAPQSPVEGAEPQGERQPAERPQGDRYERQDRGQQQPQGDGQRREFRDRGDRPFNQDRNRNDQPRRAWEDRGDRQAERAPGEARSYDRPQGERQQADRPQAERSQGDRNQGERGQGDRSQGDRGQSDRGQGDRAPSDRGDRPRYETRRERWEERGDRTATSETDVPAMVAPPSAEPPPATFEPAAADTGRMLRSEDGGVSHAPAFLSGPVAAPAEEGETRRPRTRRPRRRSEEGADASDGGSSSDQG